MFGDYKTIRRLRSKLSDAEQEALYEEKRRREAERDLAEIEEKLAAKYEAEVRKIQRQHAKEKDELQALRELKLDATKQAKRAVELETSEALMEAKKGEFEQMVRELVNAHERAETAREEGRKLGYADGVSDGLREATKITAEDRKMMGQIAALAASSHQGDASKQIADAIAKDIHRALPATTKEQ